MTDWITFVTDHDQVNRICCNVRIQELSKSSNKCLDYSVGEQVAIPIVETRFKLFVWINIHNQNQYIQPRVYNLI